MKSSEILILRERIVPMHVTRITMFAGALVMIAAAVDALVIASAGKREILSTSPRLEIRHGWTGGDIYDITFEVLPDCGTRPVRLLFPTAELVQDSHTSSSVRADALVTTAGIWVSYDHAHRVRFPVRMVVQQDNPTTWPVGVRLPEPTSRRSRWTDYVELKPGQASSFKLRFSLPPMALDRRLRPKDVAETLTLTIDHVDVGCSEPLTLRREFPIHGRDLLLKLGPRAG